MHHLVYHLLEYLIPGCHPQEYLLLAFHHLDYLLMGYLHQEYLPLGYLPQEYHPQEYLPLGYHHLGCLFLVTLLQRFPLFLHQLHLPGVTILNPCTPPLHAILLPLPEVIFPLLLEHPITHLNSNSDLQGQGHLIHGPQLQSIQQQQLQPQQVQINQWPQGNRLLEMKSVK